MSYANPGEHVPTALAQSRLFLTRAGSLKLRQLLVEDAVHDRETGENASC